MRRHRFGLIARLLGQVSLLAPIAVLAAASVHGCGSGDSRDDRADASDCPSGTFATPDGCLTCEQARAHVGKAVYAVLDGAQACSTDIQCTSSGNIALGCLNACAVPIAASHSGDLSKALVEAKYGGFCVCYQQPPECFATASVACVAGTCQFSVATALGAVQLDVPPAERRSSRVSPSVPRPRATTLSSALARVRSRRALCYDEPRRSRVNACPVTVGRPNDDDQQHAFHVPSAARGKRLDVRPFGCAPRPARSPSVATRKPSDRIAGQRRPNLFTGLGGRRGPATDQRLSG